MDAAIRTYLEEPRCAVLSTIGGDGAPHQAVVHYMLDGESVIVNGRADRRWVLNLRADPHISIVVHDTDHYLHWVGIKGAAELLRDGQPAVDDAMAIARRYGEDPAGFAGQDRVSFRLEPRRIFEYKL